jgi:hypothetical protein
MTRAWFVAVLASMCAFYFGTELIYIERLPLVMDEFQGASAVDRLRHATPYSDFAPYKTVLGYYLQLPAMLFPGDLWTRMLHVKVEMALVAALSIFAAGVLMARSFRRDASLCAVACWVCMSCFLERSAELRVDMLTGVAGVFVFLFVMEQRPVSAGLAAGISFLLSQKGAYFCVAGGLAFGSYCLVVDRRRARVGDATLFGIATLAVIAAYTILFGLGSSLDAVTQATFVAPANISVSSGPYKHLREYWFQALARDPYFYLVAVLGIGAAFGSVQQTRSLRDWTVFTFGATVACLGIWHSQPWPYFFVLIIPSLAVCAGFSFDHIARSDRSMTFWVLFVTLGVLFPLSRMPLALARNSDYQRYSVLLAQSMLRPQDTYLAGVEMVYSHAQSPKALAWVDVARAAALRKAATGPLIRSLDDAPPKLLLRNYRMNSLPMRVRLYLRRNYKHFSGPIWTYCPRLDDESFRLGYSGTYEVSARNDFFIDGIAMQPQQHVRLTTGPHRATTTGFSLCWIPGRRAQASVEAKFAREADLFPHMYDW